jgi:CheY-like chemotaxis protein
MNQTNMLTMTNRRLIYVVDDSKIIAHIVTHVISEMPGMKAFHFQTGEEMLAAMDRYKPDLILLDYYLDTQSRSHMNGSEVMQAVRSRYPDLKIILLTGMNDMAKVEEIRQLGFDDVLHKDNEDILKDVVDCVHRNLRA